MIKRINKLNMGPVKDEPGLVIITNEQDQKVYLNKSDKLYSRLKWFDNSLYSKTYNNKEMIKDYYDGLLLNLSFNWSDDFNNCNNLASIKELYKKYKLYNRLRNPEIKAYIDFTHGHSPVPFHFLVFLGGVNLDPNKIIPVGVFKSLNQAEAFRKANYSMRFFKMLLVDTSPMTEQYISWYNERNQSKF